MTDVEKLKEYISKSGLKLSFISEKLGISRYGLHLKLTNENEFKVSEMITLCDLLEIPNEDKIAIFFAHKDD